MVRMKCISSYFEVIVIYCEKLFDVLDRRLADKKSIDTIAEELCPGISKGRDKVIRIIKIHRGGQYLLDNYEWLGYNKFNVRNPRGNRSYEVKPKKSEMLFKPSLSTRKPTDEEYRKWIDSLTEIANALTILDDEMKNTTEGRYVWKVEKLKKRTIELRKLIKEKITDLNSDEMNSNDPEEKPKYNKIEIHRKIFEIAKEQISLVGKVNIYKIAKVLEISNSTSRRHVNKMNAELEVLIKKWQEERNKQMEQISSV